MTAPMFFATKTSATSANVQCGWVVMQGCSTLFTEGHRKYGFETAESGGVAVLRDGVGLIEPENIVGEASNSREDARIFSNARCIFA